LGRRARTIKCDFLSQRATRMKEKTSKTAEKNLVWNQEKGRRIVVEVAEPGGASVFHPAAPKQYTEGTARAISNEALKRVFVSGPGSVHFSEKKTGESAQGRAVSLVGKTYECRHKIPKKEENNSKSLNNPSGQPEAKNNGTAYKQGLAIVSRATLLGGLGRRRVNSRT